MITHKSHNEEDRPGASERLEAVYNAGLAKQAREPTAKTRSPSRLPSLNLAQARILIVCDDDCLSRDLEAILLHEGFPSERVKGMKAGCEQVRSGRFQVVVTAPFAGGGSWQRLVDIDSHDHLGVTVILVATSFDLNEWSRALQEGAFEVLDALYELPRAGEAARRALWAAYLKGAGLRPAVSVRQKVE